MLQQLPHAIKLALRRSPAGPLLVRMLRTWRGSAVLARGRREGWDAAARWLLSEGRNLLANEAMHRRLRNSINMDIDAEFLWTTVRKRILLDGLNPVSRPDLWDTVISLVCQCINNEYVWYVSDEEQNVLGMNHDPAVMASAPRSPGAAAILAMYRRIERLFPGAASDKNALLRPEDVPAAWTSMIDTYLREYREERLYKTSVPRFDGITRAASTLIAETYEDYPYPRWLDWEMPEAGHREKWLNDFFTPGELTFLDRPFQMLVAGCGTGAKAISYAIGYGPHARILAIDLSRASLAYAMRMARRYNIGNIDFIQMDLLDLPRLGRTFDMIECTGVLHHLEDPTEGGKALMAVLREDGIAHLSLYSELARHEIVRLRKRHEERIGNITDDEVRTFRWRLMQEDPASIDERLSLRWDFFDMNRCRDLLFHPREHRFTLPAVATLLDELGLEFRGLQPPAPDRNRYWTCYPHKRDRRNLTRWHEFELAHPDAFGSLYEIWALKKQKTVSRKRIGKMGQPHAGVFHTGLG